MTRMVTRPMVRRGAVATASFATVVLSALLFAACPLPFNNPVDPESSSYGGVSVAGDVGSLSAVEPADGEVLEELEYLRLEPVDGAEYQFQLAAGIGNGTAPDFSDAGALLLDRDWDESEYLPLPSDVLIPGTYWWRGRARAGTSVGAWCEPVQFTYAQYTAPEFGAWASYSDTSADGLTTARAYLGAVAVGDANGVGRLYAIGGVASGVYMSSIEYIDLSSSDPGANVWTDYGTSLPAARGYAGTTTAEVGGNTFVYVSGGSTGTVRYDSVYYAAVTGASLGSFAATTALPERGIDAVQGFYQDEDDVQLFFGDWYTDTVSSSDYDHYFITADSASTYTFYWRDAFTYGSGYTDIKGYVYDDGSLVTSFDDAGSLTISGRSGEIEIVVQPYNTNSGTYAVMVDADLSAGSGDVGSVYAHQLTSATTDDGTWLYVTGGVDASLSASNAVFRAPVNSDGTVGDWIEEPSLAVARRGHAAVVCETRGVQYLYVIGGDGISSVEFAQIADDGSLGEWITADESLPGQRSSTGATVVESAGRPWIMLYGGDSNSTSGNASNTIYATAIDEGGEPHGWSAVDSLAASSRGHAVASLGSTVYVVGGINYYDNYRSEFQHASVTGAAVGAPNPRVSPGNSTFTGDLTVTVLPPASWLDYDIATYYTTNGTAPTTSDSQVPVGGTTMTLSSGATAQTYTVKVMSVAADAESAVVARTYTAVPAGYVGDWASSGATLSRGKYAGATAAWESGDQTYLYILGGRTSTVSSSMVADRDVVSIGADGTVVRSGDTSLHNERCLGAAAVYETGGVPYIYYMGGYNSGSSYTYIYRSTIASDGSLGSSTYVDTLTYNNYGLGAAVFDGYLYTVGGYNSTHGNRSSSAQLDGYGDIGSWTLDADLLNANRFNSGFATATIGSSTYFYAVGGNGTSAVEYAPQASNGGIGGWSTTTPIPDRTTEVEGAAVAVSGDRIYVIGGLDGSTHLDTVYWNTIESDGQLGATWASAESLPQARYQASAWADESSVYVFGGYTGSVALSSIIVGEIYE